MFKYAGPDIQDRESVARYRPNSPLLHAASTIRTRAPAAYQLLTLGTSRASTMSQTSLGSHIAARLVEIGVSKYFCVPGDYNMTLLDELNACKGLQMVNCCNELNAGYAADGYARAKGKHVFSLASLPHFCVSAIFIGLQRTLQALGAWLSPSQWED